jgi:hypothetical protein
MLLSMRRSFLLNVVLILRDWTDRRPLLIGSSSILETIIVKIFFYCRGLSVATDSKCWNVFVFGT